MNLDVAYDLENWVYEFESDTPVTDIFGDLSDFLGDLFGDLDYDLPFG